MSQPPESLESPAQFTSGGTEYNESLHTSAVSPVDHAGDEVTAPKEKKDVIAEDELYRLAWETRNFEIKLFWERSNYFLVLSTAAAVGFFTIDSEVEEIALSVFGILVSLLWFAVNLGSKFWQSRWERRLAILEQKLAPGANLFSATPEVIQEDVRESLKFNKHGKVREILNKLILKKPSVSIAMFLLSGTFTLFWLALFILRLVELSTAG